MKVEPGQIWKDDSSGIEVEILTAEFGKPTVELQEIDNPRPGIISYVDLYQNFTFVRWKAKP